MSTNTDLEHLILALAFLSPPDREKAGLTEKFFTSKDDRAIFRVIKKAGDRTDLTFLQNELTGKIDPLYILSIFEGVAGSQAHRLPKYISDLRLKRKQLEAAEFLETFGKAGDLTKAEQLLREIVEIKTEGITGDNLLCFKDIPEEQVSWLVRGVYALGMVHALGGVQGHGKSLALIDLAARISTGSSWPITGELIPKGDVLYITDEDHRACLIKPRLRVAGADVSRVFIPDFNVETIILPDDIPKIAAWLKKLDEPRALILDPFIDYAKGNLNDAVIATSIIKPLISLAEVFKIAIIYTAHFNKKIDLESVQRVAHSYALTSKPRLAWSLIKQDPDDDLNPHRIFVCTKSTFKPIPNMMFTIKGDGSEDNIPFMDDWRTSKISTSEALATNERRRDLKIQETEDLLVTLLEKGEMATDEIMKLAEKQGVSQSSVYRAGRKLAIKADWISGRRFWSLEGKK